MALEDTHILLPRLLSVAWLSFSLAGLDFIDQAFVLPQYGIKQVGCEERYQAHAVRIPVNTVPEYTDIRVFSVIPR